MNISDIAAGSDVKIHASISKHHVVLMTEAVVGVSAGLLVRPMEYFGKYMQFLEPSNVQIKNKRDGRVYSLMSTSITPVRTRYGNFHLIRCSSALEPDNSRKAERFSLGKLGLFGVNGNTIALKNCIINDLSMRGLSLIIDNSTKVKVGDRLDISFRYGEMLHNYEVSAVVVRMFALHGKPALGCSISNMNVDLIGLVSSKRDEKYKTGSSHTVAGSPAAEEAPLTNPKEEQIREVDEDIARQLIPERPREKRISYENPFDPSRLEHVSPNDKTLRQRKKEEKMAQQAKEIENLLDLRDI